MKRNIFFIVLIFLLITPFFKLYSQNLSVNEPSSVTFETTGLPIWVKDLRRWEIVTFGTFPFTLFLTAFVTDMVRWGTENGMDFSDAGRRYAPWPLKSAGAVNMTSDEFQRTILIAAGLSVTLALVDFFIVLSGRNNEIRRTQNGSSGSVIINITPPGDNEHFFDVPPAFSENP